MLEETCRAYCTHHAENMYVSWISHSGSIRGINYGDHIGMSISTTHAWAFSFSPPSMRRESRWEIHLVGRCVGLAIRRESGKRNNTLGSWGWQASPYCFMEVVIFDDMSDRSRCERRREQQHLEQWCEGYVRIGLHGIVFQIAECAAYCISVSAETFILMMIVRELSPCLRGELKRAAGKWADAWGNGIL